MGVGNSEKRSREREQRSKPEETRGNEKPGAEKKAGKRHMLRTLGLGMITGAADDDPSAIGTYASAGAAIGPAFLWTAPSPSQ